MWLIVFTGLAFMLICFMFIELIRESNDQMNTAEMTCLGLSPVIGVFLARLALFKLVKPTQTSFNQALTVILGFWSTENLENLFNKKCEEEDSRSLAL